MSLLSPNEGGRSFPVSETQNGMMNGTPQNHQTKPAEQSRSNAFQENGQKSPSHPIVNYAHITTCKDDFFSEVENMNPNQMENGKPKDAKISIPKGERTYQGSKATSSPDMNKNQEKEGGRRSILKKEKASRKEKKSNRSVKINEMMNTDHIFERENYREPKPPREGSYFKNKSASNDAQAPANEHEGKRIVVVGQTIVHNPSDYLSTTTHTFKY